MNNNQYSSLSEATEDLKKKGYTANFRVNENGKLTNSKGAEFEPSQVRLEEFHRFEGDSNPADSSILYVVKTKSGLKGTVIDSYGADGSEITSTFMNNTDQKEYDD